MFSEKLKEIRLKKGLSQVKLASILGVTQSAVANWERGSRIPDLDTLLLISSELSVSLDSLLEKNDNSKKITLSSLPSICGFSDGAPVFSAKSFEEVRKVASNNFLYSQWPEYIDTFKHFRNGTAVVYYTRINAINSTFKVV